ncbi:MAG: Rrf2 family transcriptional regulator [Sedimentisphaerales bacterium]|nr:Rrf2 family transcriptional regulator [Sedimentisphaerales bacterium]
MRVSRSTGYALLAVGFIAKTQGKGVVLSQNISKEYEIPLEYLLKILQQLVRANVLRSKRGPRGGFSLAKPAAKITMLEVIEAVDGPLTGELNLTEQAGRDKYAVKAEQTYNKAISQARSVFQKAKLSTMLGGK